MANLLSRTKRLDFRHRRESGAQSRVRQASRRDETDGGATLDGLPGA